MELVIFLKGIIIGFAVSAPMGPMAIMVVQRTLSQGRWRGFFSGLGVGVADTIFAVFAGFGLTVLLDFITSHAFIFKILGAIVLLVLGVQMYLSDPVKDKRKQIRQKPQRVWGLISQMALLTISNPLSILIVAGIFASFGIINENTHNLSIIVLISGVALGTVAWWFSVSSLVSLFNKKIRLRHLFWINKFAGVGIAVFGIIALLSLIIK